MNIFIWEQIEKVSNNYHREGGLVIFAESEQRARELANSTDGVELGDEPPDHVISCDETPENVIVFPDAGCC